jgi:Protein of unknown function (DUF1566)
VGDTGPGGGEVFYVAATQQSWGRYLEAAPTDYQVSGVPKDVPWGCNGTDTGAIDTAIGTGKANTDKILAKCTTIDIAADVANKYSTSTAVAGQWFLPSKDELNELCKYARQTGQAVGGGTVCSGGSLDNGFAAYYYWSSSETSPNTAFDRYFYAGGQYNPNKNDTAYVRPVRAF